MALAQCENCANGHHRLSTGTGKECLSQRDVLPVDCGCWCLEEDHRPRGVKPLIEIDDGTHYALSQLRQHGVQVRTKKNGSLTWKPAFDRLPEKLQVEIKANKMGLTRALASWVSHLPLARDGWVYSTTAACVGCGKSSVLRDPLGHPRHSWCGWLGQVPVVEPIVRVPCYPTFRGAA